VEKPQCSSTQAIQCNSTQATQCGSTASSPRTRAELISDGQRLIESVSSSPRLDCEILLRHALGASQSQLLASLREPCDQQLANRYLELVKQRASGEPIAYIIGEREFWGLSFKVTPDVLIPRPETEQVVSRALELVKLRQLKISQAEDTQRGLNILDLGTGSGAIAVALVSELRKRGAVGARCDCVDISRAALAVARENAKRHSVSDALRFIESDWCSNIAELAPPYDLIVANPPYIDPKQEVAIELSFEPKSALFSEESGLRDARIILSQAVNILAPSGAILCEIGASKINLVEPLLAPYRLASNGNTGFECQVLGNPANLDSFAFIELRARG
jgi:release factor glutamine methyltransferase